MSANESARDVPVSSGKEPTTMLPEATADPQELERLQQALIDSEERAKGHWEQYLRAVAELDNVRKRAQRDIEAANRYGLEKFATELLPVTDARLAEPGLTLDALATRNVPLQRIVLAGGASRTASVLGRSTLQPRRQSHVSSPRSTTTNRKTLHLNGPQRTELAGRSCVLIW